MKHLLGNWTLKLTALVLAIGLWGHVRGEVNPLEIATFTVKLNETIPASFEVANKSDIPKTVRVTMRAPRVRLREIKGGIPSNPLAPPDEAPLISPRYLSAHLAFQSPKVGESTVPIKVDNNVEDSEILGIKPSDLVLELSKNASSSKVGN
jgi:hypothetical protein